jgi:hypothetical protein
MPASKLVDKKCSNSGEIKKICSWPWIENREKSFEPIIVTDT